MDAHASEIRCIASERRLGKFVVDQRTWQRMDLRVVRRVMQSFLVVAAVPVKGKPYLSVYTAHSHLFEQLAQGEEPPQYELKLSQDGYRVTVKRVEEQASALEKMEQALQEVG